MNSKLESLKAKQIRSRFVRVESIKQGMFIVSDVFDLSQWTLLSCEKEVRRRTLALVSGPFNMRVTAVSLNGHSGESDKPHPLRTLGGYVSK